MEFETEYQKRGKEGGYDTITRGSRIYDGLWALAFALNHTMTMVNSRNIDGTLCQNASGSLVPLHQFTYSNELMGCLIQWSLQETDFSGLSVSRKHKILCIIIILFGQNYRATLGLIEMELASTPLLKSCSTSEKVL